MAALHILHVMPQAIGWKIVPTTQSPPLAVTRTRDEALALAMRMQYEDPDAGEILIYGMDGQVRDRATIDLRTLHPSRG